MNLQGNRVSLWQVGLIYFGIGLTICDLVNERILRPRIRDTARSVLDANAERIALRRLAGGVLRAHHVPRLLMVKPIFALV